MPLMAYPLFMYIKHLKHLCFYTELILTNSILLPISYIICIWINCYRFGLHPYAPPRGLSSVHELSSSNKTMVYAYILTFEKCRDFFENSNGKCAKDSLYRWKTKHLMGEHPFTC